MSKTNCGCDCNTSTVTLPLRGLGLTFDTSSIGGNGDQIIPDLRIGKETKIPMRVYGKQVYATLFDFGALPNASTKTIAHSLRDLDWYQIDQSMTRVTSGKDLLVRPVNAPHTSVVQGSWSALMDNENISMHAGQNRTDLKAVICVLYTKTSENAVDA